MLALLLAIVSLSANAQFEKKTKYVNASLTGLEMNYSKDSRFRFGFEGTAGYFVEECWMPYARIGYNHQSLKGPDVNAFELGVGTRYYFKRTGIYLSGGLLYSHESQPGNATPITASVDDAGMRFTDSAGNPVVAYYGMTQPHVRNNNISLAREAGYCFYLNHFMSVEPALYYNLCFNDFSDGSRIGLKVGFGFYF